MPHDGEFPGQHAEVSARWRAPPKKLLESGWEEWAVQGATQNQTQGGSDSCLGTQTPGLGLGRSDLRP